MTAPSADAAADRCAIVIAGMHRSGTSALARSLSVVGAEMPRTPVSAGRTSNEVIHYGEARPIVGLHDLILSSAGTSWCDARSFPSSWYRSDSAENSRKRMAEVVASEYSDFAAFIVKDPRICRLIPFWTAVLNELSAAPVFVIPFRNPLEVAASLARRNAFTVTHSLLLWLRHVIDAERDTRGYRRAFIAYEELLRDPEATVKGLCDQIQVNRLQVDQPAVTELRGVVSSSMRNHDFSDNPSVSCGGIQLQAEAVYRGLQNGYRLGSNSALPGLLERIGIQLDAIIACGGWKRFD